MTEVTSVMKVEREIRHTRQEMEATLDELDRRFSPRGAQKMIEHGFCLARREAEKRLSAAAERPEASLARLGNRAQNLLREKPIFTLLAGTVLGLLLANRTTRPNDQDLPRQR